MHLPEWFAATSLLINDGSSEENWPQIIAEYASLLNRSRCFNKVKWDQLANWCRYAALAHLKTIVPEQSKYLDSTLIVLEARANGENMPFEPETFVIDCITYARGSDFLINFLWKVVIATAYNNYKQDKRTCVDRMTAIFFSKVGALA